jgi:hypothetical protein
MKGSQMNTIDLSKDSVAELIGMAKGWVDDCEALTRLCNAEYKEEPTQEDKDKQSYDEGEIHYISILSGLKASLTSATVLAWLKKCEDNKKEWLSLNLRIMQSALGLLLKIKRL